MTNYQKIKEMGIEEMAKLLLNIYHDGWTDGVEYEIEAPEYLSWLESEVDENGVKAKISRTAGGKMKIEHSETKKQSLEIED